MPASKYKDREYRNKYQREYRAKNKERLAAQKKLYYEANKELLVEKSRKYRADPKNAAKLEKLASNGRLRTRHKITAQVRAMMSEEQGGVCAICGNPETAVNRGKARELSIDHNHETGKIRGLLCHKCNMALGLFMDDLDLLASASSYLINNNGLKLVV